MSNVIVNKEKIDLLANAIANKSGESVPLTFPEMIGAVDEIEVGITPVGNINITSAGTADVTNYAIATVPQGSVIGKTSDYTASSSSTGTYNNKLTVLGDVDTTPLIPTAGFISSVSPSSRKVTLRTNIPMNPSTSVVNNSVLMPSGYYSSASTVTVSGGGANFDTVTMTNSYNQATSITFTLPSGRTPKAFFARFTSQIARNSSNRYYFVYDMRWDGSSTGGVAGNTFYMYNGKLTNITDGYSYTQSGTAFSLTSTGSRSASPGAFCNGTYQMVYVY